MSLSSDLNHSQLAAPTTLKRELSENSTNYTLESQPSNIFPLFPSSLSYTSVRDFAYAVSHHMHYGPPVESLEVLSGVSTPISECAEPLSDPLELWDAKRSLGLGLCGEKRLKGEQLTPINYGDGPPWSEDEDLHSPVVISSRHRKYKSSTPDIGGAKGQSRKETEETISSSLSRTNFEHNQGYMANLPSNGNKGDHGGQKGNPTRPGDGAVKCPYEDSQVSDMELYNSLGQKDPQFPGTLPSRSYSGEALQERSGSETSSTVSSPGYLRREESRYSRDYQFTIASSDEEMHGKAVALFDFVSENENELPLVEGQIIWVSYRNGQGWLVAEDPKTRESGLVPEEYVRLLRDIHGGLNCVTGNINDPLSPILPESGTPMLLDQGQSLGQFSNGNSYQPSIVSTFSTSSKDLHPYPQHLLGTQAGQVPPQVIHYPAKRSGSQVDMSIVLSPFKELQYEKNNPKRPRSEEGHRNAFSTDLSPLIPTDLSNEILMSNNANESESSGFDKADEGRKSPHVNSNSVGGMG